MLTNEHKCVIIKKTKFGGLYMELQATENQCIANRDTVTKFVHDVADMEVRAFTLRRAAKRIRKDVQKKKEELENNCRLKKSCCKLCEEPLTEARKELIDLKKELEELAKEQNRSFNNLIITILKNSLYSTLK